MRQVINRRLILFLVLTIPVLTAVSQENFLSRRITLTLNRVPLETALEKIGRAGGFSFSYDARIIHGDSLVSVKASKTIAGEIVARLTGPGIRTKQVGTHLILLPVTVTPESGKKLKHALSGIVMNAQTGDPIPSATIYEVDGKMNVLSGSDGAYRLEIPAGEELRGITYCRSGYIDTVIFIQSTAERKIDMMLMPVPVLKQIGIRQVTAMEAVTDTIVSEDSLKMVEEIGLVKMFVPEKSRETGRNLDIYGTRTFQLSFVPYLGTNGRLSGSMANAVSLNLLAGYSRETNGVEIGGLLNINRQRMRGFQAGVAGNIVGSDMNGFQVGGLFNIVLGPLRGWQVTGGVSYHADTLRGFQITGLCNITTGRMRGFQVAGVCNVATQHVNGWQIALGGNIGMKEMNRVQIGGLFNYGRDNWGFQLGGLVNIAKRNNRGVQIAGLLNYTGTLRGFQLALINIVGSVESGIPVGFFTYVHRGGYYRLEVSADEVFWINVALRAGTSRFYNIFKVGTGDSWMVNFTWGAGTLFPVSDLFSVALDLTIGGVMSTTSGLKYHGLQGKIYPTFDFRLADHLSLFFGPQANVYWFNTGSTVKPDGIAPYTIYDHTFTTGPHRIQLWVGGIVGIKI